MQTYVGMNRLEGRIWFDPGIPSLCVPYHDTNDFYFSGHLGCITMWGLEMKSHGNKCVAYYCVCLAVLMWVFLTIMRVHYFIDLISGVLIGHWVFMQCDWMSYIIDVKIFGLGHKNRGLYMHEACIRCGWSN